MKKEILQPNHVDATLFIGVGGVGSDIVKRVGDLCLNDDRSAVRFVTLDTDVNDLTRVEKGVQITTIQTSSPRSVRDYLDDDKDTENWFPGNNILDSKTVSEGAGQVRAISRLALNATIKNGGINKLYKQIDELFLKNGKDKNHAVKVVIVSTSAGGTGSGIAMIAGMLVRHYIKTNYPESAAIIRGYLVLPGVLNGTVIASESERQSLLRNGYATIKEINAFMMNGSGFFESERKLRRYKGLHVTIPTSGGGHLKLSGLPFDFCFLLDRVDGVQRSMKGLDQYKKNAAQTLYEQNIGPMSSSASSKEDNVIKEFMEPTSYGRSRFGGAGSAVLRYPYADVCEYMAASMAQKLLLGGTAKGVSDEELEKMITNSWLKYDLGFVKMRKEWDKKPSGSIKNEPKLYTYYVNEIEGAQEGDKFTELLFHRYLKGKIGGTFESLSQLKDGSNELLKQYFEKLKEAAIDYVLGRLGLDEYVESAEKSEVPQNKNTKYKKRYDGIGLLEGVAKDGDLDVFVRDFARSVLCNEASILNGELGEHMLQSLLSDQGNALHPNAIRYLLYKLKITLETVKNSFAPNKGYEATLDDVKFGITGEGDSKSVDVKKFAVSNGIGKVEHSLKDMCISCDELEPGKGMGDKANCNELLDSYFNAVNSNYTKIIENRLARAALVYIDKLCKAFEDFFNTFKDKTISLEKKKENIVSNLAFNNGDCVVNLFGKVEHLEQLADRLGLSADDRNAELFAQIFDMVKENAEMSDDDIRHDVFDEVMIGYYRDVIDNKYSDVLDVDILHALKLEYTVMREVEQAAAPDADKDAIAKRAKDKNEIDRYIREKMNDCRNLATPGICRKSFDEARDVNAVTYSIYVKDGDGLRVSDFFSERDASNTVSKYEVRFFRSIYVVTPLQLFQFCAPRPDGDLAPHTEVIDYSDKSGAGESFNQYQIYMENIGPDSRLNSIITPHIDSRWSSISVMPELDLNYQERLMKHIHKAMFYGFMFDVISLHTLSPKYDEARKVYRYLDGDNGLKKMIVSNKTKCDKFYEVLDALYFDRAAVKSIHASAAKVRDDDIQNSVSFEQSEFSKKMNELTLGKLICTSGEGCDTPCSVFEIPYQYYRSMPARNTDDAEIEIMTNAIIEAINSEVSCFDKADDLGAHTATILIDQFNKFAEMHTDGSDEDIVKTVRRRVVEALRDFDISDSMLKTLK